MRLKLTVATMFILSASLGARADSYETFDVNATAGYADYAVTGTLTFDTTTSTFTDSDLSTAFGSITGAPTFEEGFPSVDPTSFYFGFGDYGVGPYVYFGLPATSLSGYSGGNLCSTAQACTDGGSYLDSSNTSIYEFNRGAALTLVSSQTPEPSSFLLLGSGLLGVAGVIRKRLA